MHDMVGVVCVCSSNGELVQAKDRVTSDKVYVVCALLCSAMEAKKVFVYVRVCVCVCVCVCVYT